MQHGSGTSVALCSPHAVPISIAPGLLAHLPFNRFYSDDGSLEKAPWIQQWIETMDEATTKFGKRMNVAHEQKKLMEEAGFVNVQEQVLKVSLKLSLGPSRVRFR